VLIKQKHFSNGRFTKAWDFKHSYYIKDLNMPVFQGTIPGPTLFSCFINDIPHSTELLTILYADDTTGLDTDTDLNTLLDRVSSELTKMAAWFRANKMSLNTNKTKYIIFHAPGKKIASSISLTIDENIPGTPHNPSLITSVDLIHTRQPDYNSQAIKLPVIYIDDT